MKTITDIKITHPTWTRRGAPSRQGTTMKKVMMWGALALGGCGDAEPDDVCSQLARTPSCNGEETRQNCEDRIASAKAGSRLCAPFIDALAECIAPLELTCTSATGIAANGDGLIGGGENYTDIDGIDVVVNDSTCDAHRRGLEACRTCPEAVGATEVGVLGIGDQCNDTGCAAGLMCQDGVCTRPCASDDDCMARADDCRLQYQYPNVCASSGLCTRSCGSDSECEVWITSGSVCLENACTLPSAPPDPPPDPWSSDPTADGEETGSDPENTPSTCEDMIDNDGDGYVDCDASFPDFECCGVGSCQCTGACADKGACAMRDSEDNEAACTDEKDNDGDGYIDCDASFPDFQCCGVGSCACTGACAGNGSCP